MTDDHQDSGFKDDWAQRLARLAALQRLKDDAARNDRASMFHTLDKLIEAEKRAMHRLSPTRSDHP